MQICLGPGPSLQHNANKFELFHKLDLHFFDINVNKLLKIDKLRYIVDHTKPAILGTTESKINSSVSDQEVNINGYSILRGDRDRNSRGVACYTRADLCFSSKNIFSNSIEHALFGSTYPKSEVYLKWHFYR